MEYLCICNHTNSNGESAMEFLAICSHTDFTRESVIWFLASAAFWLQLVWLQMARTP